MNRNFSTEAVILSLSPLGENNTLVTLLTKDRGIVKACLYGGAKSKLKSLCAQWNTGIVWIYETPEKNQNKISDFDVKKYHLTFGESLFKSYAALLAAELVVKTECAGGGDNILNCWNLLNGFLDGLELSTEEQGKAGLIRFLWRFSGISGLQPDTEYCSFCEKSFFENNGENPQKSCKLYYTMKENGFVCPDCQSHTEASQNLPLSLTALKYLHAVTNLPPLKSRNFPLDKSSAEEIKALVFNLAEQAANAPLNTIRIGLGIL